MQKFVVNQSDFSTWMRVNKIQKKMYLTVVMRVKARKARKIMINKLTNKIKSLKKMAT